MYVTIVLIHCRYRMLGEKGLPAIVKDIGKIKLKGKGHELQDLEKLLKYYQLWLHQLKPNLSFPAAIAKAESLCKERRIKLFLNNYLVEEGRKRAKINDDREMEREDEALRAQYEATRDDDQHRQEGQQTSPNDALFNTDFADEDNAHLHSDSLPKYDTMNSDDDEEAEILKRMQQNREQASERLMMDNNEASRTIISETVALIESNPVELIISESIADDQRAALEAEFGDW